MDIGGNIIVFINIICLKLCWYFSNYLYILFNIQCGYICLELHPHFKGWNFTNSTQCRAKFSNGENAICIGIFLFEYIIISTVKIRNLQFCILAIISSKTVQFVATVLN